VLPLVFGPLGVEVISSHAFSTTRVQSDPTELEQSIEQARQLVPAVGADLGAVFDLAGERLYLIDDRGEEIPLEQTLLLFLKLLGESGRTGKLALPVTATSLVDKLVEGTGLEVVRTAHSLADLTKSAAEEGVVFAGAMGGGYVFPEFLPAYDAVAALSNLLQLLAPVKRPVSELVAELPVSPLVHSELPCPWAMKGVVMRVLNEQLADRRLDLLDGIKVFDERGWMQALPDPDEPVLHLYAEGQDEETTAALEAELRGLVEEILQGDEAGARNVKAKV
jgi:mannose-1-phosphate guanylyltransferase/phosphomannomutase